MVVTTFLVISIPSGLLAPTNNIQTLYRKKLDKVDFLADLKSLISKSNELMLLRGRGTPVITKSIKHRTGSLNSIKKFTNMLVDVFMFIVNNNNQLEIGIKKNLCKLWKQDFKQFLRVDLEPWSGWNTACIMSYSHISNRTKEMLNNAAVDHFGCKIFATRRQIQQIHQKIYPIQDTFLSLQKKPKRKKTASKISIKKGNIIAYCFSIFLALAMNLDCYINTNRFDPIDTLCGANGRTLPCGLGSDKCDIEGMGCYVYSVAVHGGPSSSSASASTVSLLVYGGFKDDGRGIADIYEKSGYDDELEAINRLAAMITVIKYKTVSIIGGDDNNDKDDVVGDDDNNNDQDDVVGDDNEIIVSREVVSGVLAFDPDIHAELNSNLNKSKTKHERQQQWKQDNPMKSIQYTSTQIDASKTEQLVSWEYKKNKDRLGLRQTQSKISIQPTKVHYNWQTATKDYVKFLLDNPVWPSELLAVRGYYRETQNVNNNQHNGINIYKSKIAKIVNEIGTNSLAAKPTQKTLYYVDDFKLTNGIYLLIYSSLIIYILYTIITIFLLFVTCK